MLSVFTDEVIMFSENKRPYFDELKKSYTDKFASLNDIFKHIHRGDRIFIGTACGEPQYLVQALSDYVDKNPKAFFDTEVFHVWTMGVAPYAHEKFKRNFRLNSFFVGNNSRDAVNKGLADYTPVFFSEVPALIASGIVKFDIALIQTSLPDKHGYVSLGISVDIVKAAVERASLVIAQSNSFMPRAHGDTFIHVSDIDYIVPYDEPLLEFKPSVSDDIAQKIGEYVSRIVQDGDTIQVGYGSHAQCDYCKPERQKASGRSHRADFRRHRRAHEGGRHRQFAKKYGKGKTVASFCMGTKETYEYIHDNPEIEFRTIDVTNNPLTIASLEQHGGHQLGPADRFTGQSSSESIGKYFYSGIGGHADFMRGTALSPNGKTILTLRSTSNDGLHSRIVPLLEEGSGTSLTRGDIHYVITEYGIAYLHGKNIRERAMDLIGIAHPKFRPWLIEEAKRLGLIYKDQAFIPGKRGEYPESLETWRTTRSGFTVLLRPGQNQR